MDHDMQAELQKFARSGRGLMLDQAPETWAVWQQLEQDGYIALKDAKETYVRYGITEAGREVLEG